MALHTQIHFFIGCNWQWDKEKQDWSTRQSVQNLAAAVQPSNLNLFFPRRCKNLPLSSHFCGEDGEGGAVQVRMMYLPLMKSLNSWKRIGTSSIKMEMRHWITHSTHQPVTIPPNRISDRRLLGIYQILKGLQKLSSVTLCQEFSSVSQKITNN